jgi:lipopolysaccharide biosynthesis glycosyltransferase
MIRFVIAADKKFYCHLSALIGSIYRRCSDFRISFYDLGLLPEQITVLSKIKNITIKEVEAVNPYILTELRSHPFDPVNDVMVTGLYSWKPVILKQELDEHEAILYLDAGMMVMKDITPLWDYIKENGYWLTPVCDINWMTTSYIKEKLNVSYETLFATGIHAGMQGLTRSVYNSYVLPCYEYAKDIELFKDHGTSHGGLSSGRHDQTLFSIQAARSGLKPSNAIPIARNRSLITDESIIYTCAGDSINFDLKILL